MRNAGAETEGPDKKRLHRIGVIGNKEIEKKLSQYNTISY